MSNSDRVRKTLKASSDPTDRKVTRTLPDKDWQGHYVIPLKQVKDNQILFDAASKVKDGFRTDEASNIVALPTNARAQQALQTHGIIRPIHGSGHAKTRDDVKARVDEISPALRKEGLTPNTPEYGKRANELIRNLESELRSQLPETGKLTMNMTSMQSKQIA